MLDGQKDVRIADLMAQYALDLHRSQPWHKIASIEDHRVTDYKITDAGTREKSRKCSKQSQRVKDLQ